jgi:PPOX class probable F420-dependent enzyme
MDLATAVGFARTTTHSVMVTVRRDGRPQLSNVLHAVFDDGTIRISTTADRAKARNLAREPWAALHVTQADFWGYAVIEADAELTGVAEDPGDASVDMLVEHYRALLGEQGDWPAFRAQQVADQRLLVLLRPTRAYGMLPAS